MVGSMEAAARTTSAIGIRQPVSPSIVIGLRLRWRRRHTTRRSRSCASSTRAHTCHYISNLILPTQKFVAPTSLSSSDGGLFPPVGCMLCAREFLSVCRTSIESITAPMDGTVAVLGLYAAQRPAEIYTSGMGPAKHNSVMVAALLDSPRLVDLSWVEPSCLKPPCLKPSCLSFDQVSGVPGWPTTGSFDPSQTRSVLGGAVERYCCERMAPVRCFIRLIAVGKRGMGNDDS